MNNVNNDDDRNWEWSCDALVCVKYGSDWFSLVLITLTDDLPQSADKDQQESRAVAGKPHAQCRCKIRYVSTFMAASRGSLCDSTAFLLENTAHLHKTAPRDEMVRDPREETPRPLRPRQRRDVRSSQVSRRSRNQDVEIIQCVGVAIRRLARNCPE